MSNTIPAYKNYMKCITAFFTAFIGAGAVGTTANGGIDWTVAIGSVGAGLVSGAAVWRAENKKNLPPAPEAPPAPTPGELLAGAKVLQQTFNTQVDEMTEKATGAMGDMVEAVTGLLPGGVDDSLFNAILRKK